MYNPYNIKEINIEEIIVYLRKSRADDPLLSVEEVLKKHETILDEWCVQNLGAKVPECNKFREVVSGESIEDRIAFQKILKLVESPKYKAVLVVELQRLGRPDLEEIGKITKIFRYTDTKIIIPQKIYDLRDEYDRDSFERELKRGNEFLEYQKKIMGRGRLLSVSQGNYIASIPPYGYDKVWVNDGNRKYPTLAENKEEADVVRLIFDLYVNKDLGYQRICNTLEDMKISPPKGEHWSPPSLKDMLNNVHYIGKVKWNWRKTITIVEDSEIVKTRPKAKTGDFLIYDGKHNGIVSEELFNAANDKMGKVSRTIPSKKVKNAFASLLFCSCGKAMSLRSYKNKDGTERCLPRLLCDQQRHCHTSSCTYDEMLDMICDILEQQIMNFEQEVKNKELHNSEILHKNLIKSLEKKLKDIRARQLSQWERQTDPNLDKRMPEDVFEELKANLMKEKEEVEQALRNAYDSIPTPINYEEKIITFKDALSALRDPNVEGGEKNKLLKMCIDRIEYSREKAERLKRKPDEKKGTVFTSVGSYWSNPKIEINVKLKV